MSSTWLLDVYPDEAGKSLLPWVKSGSRTTRRRVPYQATLRVAPAASSLRFAKRVLDDDRRVQETWLEDAVLSLQGSPQQTLVVQPHRFRDLHAVATDLRKRAGVAAFDIYDVDVPVESRWTHDNGIFPFCRLDRFWDTSDDRWRLDYDTPDLPGMDLEVHAPQGPRRDHGVPLQVIHAGGEVFHADGPDSEVDALRDFANHLDRLDPDILYTRGGDTWDIPYLLHRIRVNGLGDRIRLGRGPDPQRPAIQEKSYWTYGRIVHRSQAWTLKGRFHLDLQKKFLPDSEERRDASGLVYLSRIANKRIQEVARNGPGSCIQQMQIDAARSQGVAIGWKRNLTEDWKTARVLTAVDRGGQIHAPVPGVYGDVWACDFSAYYPSIITAHNLSSDALNCTCCPDAPEIPDLGYHACQKRIGHQARVLEPVIRHRRHVKALLKRGDLDPKRRAWAQAITSELKAIGVVCFGYARYRNARYGCAEVHQAIQAIGRSGMTQAKTMAEREGYEVLHGLTDCLFFTRPCATTNEVRRLTRRISAALEVPLEIEAHYKWIVFLPSKTHPGVGVPNRYYGLRDDGTLKLRGIEVRRHNTPPWLHDVQEAMLAELAKAQDPQGFHKAIPRALAVAEAARRDLRNGRVPIQELGITITVTKDVEQYTQETAARAALRRLRQAGIPIQPGRSISYIVLRGEPGLPWQQRATPVQLIKEGGPLGRGVAPYDRKHYERLLDRAVETLFAPFLQAGPVAAGNRFFGMGDSPLRPL